jgi:hypothetical protein
MLSRFLAECRIRIIVITVWNGMWFLSAISFRKIVRDIDADATLPRCVFRSAAAMNGHDRGRKPAGIVLRRCRGELCSRRRSGKRIAQEYME